MNEVELAKRAVARRLLTLEQLRDAQVYAQGGRSLLAVLLDLGYLKAGDLPGLWGMGSPPPRRIFPVRMLLGAGVLLACLGIAWEVRELIRPRRPELPEPAPVAESARPTAPDFGHELARGGGEAVAEVERAIKAGGSLTAEMETRLRHAEAFLEESAARKAADSDALFALGRARELLDQWEAAFEAYQRALGASPDHARSHLGSARVLLNLQRFTEALARANRACELLGTGECFLVRGKVWASLGDAESAQKDLLEGRKRDPELGPEISRILGRLGE
jgi:tetratricopeptide (TPR) repeat protein